MYYSSRSVDDWMPQSFGSAPGHYFRVFFCHQVFVSQSTLKMMSQQLFVWCFCNPFCKGPPLLHCQPFPADAFQGLPTGLQALVGWTPTQQASRSKDTHLGDTRPHLGECCGGFPVVWDGDMWLDGAWLAHHMESALLDEMTIPEFQVYSRLSQMQSSFGRLSCQLSHFSKLVPWLRKYARMAQVAGTEHGKERVDRWTMERGV